LSAARSTLRDKTGQPSARMPAGRGLALRCLRRPPRYAHDEAGQVMAVPVNSIAVTGIWVVNKRLESGPLPGHKRKGWASAGPRPGSTPSPRQAGIAVCAWRCHTGGAGRRTPAPTFRHPAPGSGSARHTPARTSSGRGRTHPAACSSKRLAAGFTETYRAACPEDTLAVGRGLDRQLLEVSCPIHTKQA